MLYGKKSVLFLEYKMNVCSEIHTSTYKIIYKGIRGSNYNPEWLVCERYHDKRYFGTSEDIISLEKLN